MENVEMIEKLMEKADVTYEEAKGVLESVNWNLLDALIALEKEGKIKKPETSGFTTKQEIPENIEGFASDENRISFKEVMRRIFGWLVKIIGKGMENKLCLKNSEGNGVAEIPLTIFVILMIPGFWIILFALIFALVGGWSFSFTGPDLGNEKVNSVMSRISINGQKKSEDIDIDDKK